MRINRVKRATVPNLPARVFAASAAIVFALGLGGCGSTIASMPLIGEPEIAQKRPAVQPAYQPVFGQPGEREKKAMTPSERDKLQGELAAQRESAANAKREEINRTSAQ